MWQVVHQPAISSASSSNFVQYEFFISEGVALLMLARSSKVTGRLGLKPTCTMPFCPIIEVDGTDHSLISEVVVFMTAAYTAPLCIDE